MQADSIQIAEVNGRRIEYRLRSSTNARKLRVRVGIAGVDVVQPRGRPLEEVDRFLHANEKWILSQLDRVERLQAVRRVQQVHVGMILFKGTPTPVVVVDQPRRGGNNLVRLEAGQLIVHRGRQTFVTPSQSLENWLRRRAREAIEGELRNLSTKIKALPGRIYVMDQRTKWGNCSALQNLSFNWRLIMAPEYVLRYIVTHEFVHLVIPDHSAKFWLTLQSLCHDSERAKQWLTANGNRLLESISIEA